MQKPLKWIDQPTHRQWLLDHSQTLIRFFQTRSFNSAGGFFTLATDGSPLAQKPGFTGANRQLHETTRMVHCAAIAHLLGVPGADRNIDHGMKYLWSSHRDSHNGGYFWAVDDTGATDSKKQAYGHAFVLLAASSAKVVGHPDADQLLDDISEVLHARFWDNTIGATTEEYATDWQKIDSYRGQNSNMHLTEALMAAFEATNDSNYLTMATRIADLIINRHARENDWRVPEHFDANWNVDKGYTGDPVFRPAGTTPGHALEWSRLLIQLWELGGRQLDWAVDASKNLFFTAVETGWADSAGGFYYTLNWDNTPAQTDKFWWPCAEGIAAAAVLGMIDDDPRFEEWYRRILGFTNNYLIDHKNGGWHPELDATYQPVSNVFEGKPDLYHSLQASLIPLLKSTGSITRGLLASQGKSLIQAPVC
ncbi:MAG: AGE family epimerase/isomerase [Rhodobacteraceae bacterium]|nr:AGE family epimerase/isomerase [Paracoccaceae bacterium]